MANQEAMRPSLSRLDRIPVGATIDEVKAFAEASPEVRMAAYVNSMRRMMIFFVVTTVIALIAAIVLAIVDINTLNSLHQNQSPFG